MKIELHPVILPISPKIRVVGGPRFKNTYLEDAQGDPQSQIYWDKAKWEWTLRFVEESMTSLIGFFLARNGCGWFLKDDFDYRADFTTGLVKTMPDGNRYLMKRYPDTDNFRPYERRIRCPLPGTIAFSGVSGSPVVDPYSGQVTGATGDGAASFDFVCPVIFATDFMEMERKPGDAGSTWQVQIKEIGKFSVAN
jgi:uncharacterized protein (TIGR02217 family)